MTAFVICVGSSLLSITVDVTTTHNFFNSQESDVSLLIATAGIKSYQKKAGHSHRSYSYTHTYKIVLLHLNDFLITRKICSTHIC